MKKLFLNIIFIISVLTCFSQISSLTKKQMYADFDEFVEIIENCAVQLPAKKLVTGFDNLAEIKKLQKEIDTILTTESFIDNVLEKSLSLIMDNHTRSEYTFYSGYENLDGIDTTYMKQYSEYLMQKLISIENQRLLQSKYFPVPVSFYDNMYYIVGDNSFANKDKTKDSLKINFMKVLEFNGEDFLEYAMRNSPNATRWNFENKKFYATTIWLPTTGLLKVEQNKQIFEFNLEDYVYDMWGWINSTETITINDVPKINNAQKSLERDIKFFETDSILFIYMKSMQENAEFVNKIKEIGKNKTIKKVIIDVRGNGGGSDFAWHNVLKAIIKNPLPYKIRIAYNDTKMMKEKLNEYNNISKPYTINWLDNQKLLVIDDDDYITPDTNSLKYSGKIYVLKDDGTYSAAHSLVTYCDYLDNLISIGIVSSRLLGFGTMASLFQLKHSKFTFRLSTTMDITNCNNPEDVWHTKPEIIVNPTFEDGFIYRHSYYDILSEEYLYKYDTMFKKVLELE